MLSLFNKLRILELRARIADYFPDPDTYARDIIHSELGGISVNGAIEIGMEPNEIWQGVIRHNPEMPQRYR